MADIKTMGGYAIALSTLAAVSLVGIAVITGFKDSGTVGTCSNASAPAYTAGYCDEADAFITGIAVFGTFAAVIAIALVGKLVIGLFKGGM